MITQNNKLSCDVLIVLNSLVAEGCPQLALQLSKYWKSKGINIEILSLYSDSYDLREDFLNLGIPVHYFNLENGFFRYIKIIIKSYKICKKIRPISILSFPFGWHTFIALGSRIAGTKNICSHVGNLPPINYKIKFIKFKILVQLGRLFTKKLISCSDYIYLAVLKDFSLLENEVKTIYNSCDLELFCLKSHPQKFPQNKLPRIGMVARLEIHKDQGTLIRAAEFLKTKSISIEVWLIGDGSCRDKLQSLINSLGLEQSIKILGTRRDIDQILYSLDIFVFAAKPDEGFGIALAEAMAAGVPIVASDVGACREVLDGGELGILVEPFNPKALALGIKEVIQNPKKAFERTYKAKNKAIQTFSIERMANAYREELNF